MWMIVNIAMIWAIALASCSSLGENDISSQIFPFEFFWQWLHGQMEEVKSRFYILRAPVPLLFVVNLLFQLSSTAEWKTHNSPEARSNDSKWL